MLFRSHGEAVVGPAGYEDIVNIAGFNYRLTELQAAIAREQLKKLDRLNNCRFSLVDQLTEKLLGLSLKTNFLIINFPSKYLQYNPQLLMN